METIKRFRLGAIIIDSIVVLAITAIVSSILRTANVIPTTYVLEKYISNISVFREAYMIELVVAIIIAFVAYTLVPLKLEGATIGKKICGITVVSADGSKASFSQLVIRNFYIYFGIIALVTFVINPEVLHITKTTDFGSLDAINASDFFDRFKGTNGGIYTAGTSVVSIVRLVMFIQVFTSGGRVLLNDIVAKTKVITKFERQ